MGKAKVIPWIALSKSSDQKSETFLAFLGNDWPPPHHLQLYLVPIRPILSLMHMNSWPNLRKWIIKNREKKLVKTQSVKTKKNREFVNQCFCDVQKNMCKLLWWSMVKINSLQQLAKILYLVHEVQQPIPNQGRHQDFNTTKAKIQNFNRSLKSFLTNIAWKP